MKTDGKDRSVAVLAQSADRRYCAVPAQTGADVVIIEDLLVERLT